VDVNPPTTTTKFVRSPDGLVTDCTCPPADPLSTTFEASNPLTGSENPTSNATGSASATGS
jgi:hypothetical protein